MGVGAAHSSVVVMQETDSVSLFSPLMPLASGFPVKKEDNQLRTGYAGDGDVLRKGETETVTSMTD